MAVFVRFPTPLRKLTGGQTEVSVEGASIRDVIENLDRAHKGVRDQILDDSGSIRRFINLFLNGEDVRYLKGPDTSVQSGDKISIVPAIAGGAGLPDLRPR